MTSLTKSLEPPRHVTGASEEALRFLQLSARLLLEYNVRSKALERRIEQIARHLHVDVQTLVGYREVTLTLADGRVLHARVPELRINVAVSAHALYVIDELCLDRIGLDEATQSLESIERLARHGTDVGWSPSSSGWRHPLSPGCCAPTGVQSP